MTRRVQELRDIVIPVLKPYVSRVAVFGSYARGQESATSDVDLLVTLRPPSQRPHLGLQFFEIEAALGEKLGRKVELVTENSLSRHVRPHVQKDLIVLYED